MLKPLILVTMLAAPFSSNWGVIFVKRCLDFLILSWDESVGIMKWMSWDIGFMLSFMKRCSSQHLWDFSIYHCFTSLADLNSVWCVVPPFKRACSCLDGRLQAWLFSGERVCSCLDGRLQGSVRSCLDGRLQAWPSSGQREITIRKASMGKKCFYYSCYM